MSSVTSGNSEYEIEDFILIQDNALPEKVCEAWVEETNRIGLDFLRRFKMDAVTKPLGFVSPDATDDRDIKDRIFRSDDMDFPLSANISPMHVPMMTTMQGILQMGTVAYVDKYHALYKLGILTMPYFKYHVVQPTGGYHALHSEWTTQRPDNCRILVWHLSLTTHEKQGEMEFLYQHKRIDPKAGRLIIWPAGFTHYHKGNIMRDEEKHYITGWFYLDPDPQGISYSKQ